MNETSELQVILADQMQRILSDLVEKKTLEDSEEGIWPEKLWHTIEENGITRVLVPEDLGGAGGNWCDAEVVMRAAGRHQAPIPLIENVIANWLLAKGNIPIPNGPLSIAPVNNADKLDLTLEGDHGRLNGIASRVPWGRFIKKLVLLLETKNKLFVALVSTDKAIVEKDTNIASEPRDTLFFDDVLIDISKPIDEDKGALQRAGAMARSSQIAGALEFLLLESVKYANDRVQFGRPLGKFQAIQQELARLAGEVASSGAAVETAFRARQNNDAVFEVAVAKIITSEAATTGTSIAHQTHGAIGFTYEHPLHFATRRLWSWRSEFGTENRWSEELGRTLADNGATKLWPFLTARTAANSKIKN